jgi:hypothetical protein
MKTIISIGLNSISLICGLVLASSLLAQETPDGSGASKALAARPLPKVEKPPEGIITAEQHYNYLLNQAGGGTQHTMSTIPVWDGLWAPGNNDLVSLFIEDGTLAVALRPRENLKVREGVLTPAYEKQFKARRAEMEKFGEQLYDRLTNCEYPGVPRWLWEPYTKEFVNTPKQSWMLNDFMNETRRVYINAEHINFDAKHSATGDSIGFWQDDKLIIWTKWVNPADYLRGLPLTSNQFEMVEAWQERINEQGERQLVTHVTFYDPIALVKPLSTVYTHDSRSDLESIGIRIRNWECATTSNSYKAEDGTTQFYLPGDPEYKDPRGYTEFPDLPGQSLDPIVDAENADAE